MQTALERSGEFFSNLECDSEKESVSRKCFESFEGYGENCLIFELSVGIPVARESCNALSLFTRKPVTAPVAIVCLSAQKSNSLKRAKRKDNSNGRFFRAPSSVLSTSMIGFGLVDLGSRATHVHGKWQLCYKSCFASFLLNKKGRYSLKVSMRMNFLEATDNRTCPPDLTSSHPGHNFRRGEGLRSNGEHQDTRLS